MVQRQRKFSTQQVPNPYLFHFIYNDENEATVDNKY